MTIFDLARMRRLDLLAWWYRQLAVSRGPQADPFGQLSGDALAAAIIQSRQPYT